MGAASSVAVPSAYARPVATSSYAVPAAGTASPIAPYLQTGVVYAEGAYADGVYAEAYPEVYAADPGSRVVSERRITRDELINGGSLYQAQEEMYGVPGYAAAPTMVYEYEQPGMYAVDPAPRYYEDAYPGEVEVPVGSAYVVEKPLQQVKFATEVAYSNAVATQALPPVNYSTAVPAAAPYAAAPTQVVQLLNDVDGVHQEFSTSPMRYTAVPTMPIGAPYA